MVHGQYLHEHLLPSSPSKWREGHVIIKVQLEGERAFTHTVSRRLEGKPGTLNPSIGQSLIMGFSIATQTLQEAPATKIS